MKLRTLEEIEQDESIRYHAPAGSKLARPPTMRDLRPGAVKSFLLGIGELLLAIPKFILRLLDFGLGVAIVLGIVGCIVFGLVYLFG